MLRFEWDPQKAASNLRKHGISFEIATHVFDDPFVLSSIERIEQGEGLVVFRGESTDGFAVHRVDRGLRAGERGRDGALLAGNRDV